MRVHYARSRSRSILRHRPDPGCAEPGRRGNNSPRFSLSIRQTVHFPSCPKRRFHCRLPPHFRSLRTTNDRRSAAVRGCLGRRLPHRARGDRAPRRAAVGRGPGRAVDAGREPDQMASRAHHLVLRAVPAQAACRRLSRRSTSASPFCSTPITSRPARGTRGRSAAWSRGRTREEVAAYRAHVDRAVDGADRERRRRDAGARSSRSSRSGCTTSSSTRS